MKRTLVILAFLLLFAATTFVSAQSATPKRLEAFKKYLLEKDYPEVFKETYHVRIDGILDVDVDNDGAKEFVVLSQPHFRQSPTVVLYKVSPKLEFKRVTESLAPGPLQKISGDYLDSHNLGMAADIELRSAKSPEDMVKILRDHFSNVVAYDSFYHVDSRKGQPAYLDMRQAKPTPKAHTCDSFEFSMVKQIAVGTLREDVSRNYLAAWVGNEIYVYLIRGISNDGFLEKQLTIISVPDGFTGFEPGAGLTYKTSSGLTVLTIK